MLLREKNCPPVNLLEDIPETLRVFDNFSENRRGIYKELKADFELDNYYREE